MYGCVLTPPATPGADFGVLFLHNEGWSTMCGHGIIAVATVVLETGLFPDLDPNAVRIDTPAGLVTARARIEGGRVRSVAFLNVPSFVVALDETVDVPGLGRVRYDLAFGGAFYAYVEAADVDVACVPGDVANAIARGMAIKRAIMASRPISHPAATDLGFLYGTILSGPPSPEAQVRNVCVFAEGEVDRSPTGTGVSGRLAIEFARRRITVNEPFVVESLIGTRFTGRVVEATQVGPYSAIISEVEGTAYITGRSEFLLDPEDPLRDGFLVR